MSMWKECEGLQEELVKMRRELHQIPEFGLDLPETQKYVTDKLDELGIPYKCSGTDSSIIAEIKGGQPGKTVALRADMDALKITEANDVDYKSKHEGLMHACGHDNHIAMLLGAAKVLNAHKAEIKGNGKTIVSNKPIFDEDNEFDSKLYNKLSERSVFLHFYNIYKFIHSKESDFNFDDLIKTYAEASSGSWVPQVNEFYPKIKTELFNKLKKLSNIYWNTFNKLDSNVMKEFASVIKSFDEAVKNKDVDGAIKSIADKDMFSKIESLQYTLMDIFEIYSQEVFTKNFEFLQILKSESIDILFSDSSLLDQKTKNAVEKMFNNLNSSKMSYTELLEAEKIILRMQNRIVNVEKGTNEIILTLSKTLHLENFKSLLDFSPIMNEKKPPLLKFIKLFLNKHVNLSDRIKRKIFNKHNIILSDIPNYFINKWSYLNLTDKEFKRYVMNQKINRKLKGK